MAVEEFVLSIAGVEIAGKRWRNGTRPVLALHGWLDNAASFDVLAPQLSDADVVAIDLAGHGYSYHKPPQGTYNLWDDLPDIVRVADQLGWSQFHLLGHSRGAMISALLSAALPERVSSVTFLDGLSPPPMPVAETFNQLGRHLRDHLQVPKVAARYPSLQRALEVRCRVNGITEQVAMPIVERGLKRVGDEWLWRADPRLNYASTFKMGAKQISILHQQIAKMPHLLLLAENGFGARMINHGDLNYSALHHALLPGSHHFHLEAAADPLAEKINAFWGELPLIQGGS